MPAGSRADPTRRPCAPAAPPEGLRRPLPTRVRAGPSRPSAAALADRRPLRSVPARSPGSAPLHGGPENCHTPAWRMLSGVLAAVGVTFRPNPLHAFRWWLLAKDSDLFGGPGADCIHHRNACEFRGPPGRGAARRAAARRAAPRRPAPPRLAGPPRHHGTCPERKIALRYRRAIECGGGAYGDDCCRPNELTGLRPKFGYSARDLDPGSLPRTSSRKRPFPDP